MTGDRETGWDDNIPFWRHVWRGLVGYAVVMIVATLSRL